MEHFPAVCVFFHVPTNLHVREEFQKYCEETGLPDPTIDEFNLDGYTYYKFITSEKIKSSPEYYDYISHCICKVGNIDREPKKVKPRNPSIIRDINDLPIIGVIEDSQNEITKESSIWIANWLGVSISSRGEGYPANILLSKHLLEPIYKSLIDRGLRKMYIQDIYIIKSYLHRVLYMSVMYCMSIGGIPDIWIDNDEYCARDGLGCDKKLSEDVITAYKLCGGGSEDDVYCEHAMIYKLKKFIFGQYEIRKKLLSCVFLADIADIIIAMSCTHPNDIKLDWN